MEEIVNMVIDGREVTYRVWRCPRGVHVAMSKPYQLSTSITRPVFAMMLHNRPGWDFMGAYGDRLIGQFLNNLETLASFIHENHDSLTAAYSEASRSIESLSISHADQLTCSKSRRRLRSLLKRGHLSPKHHQRLRRDLRRSRASHKQASDDIMAEFIARNLPPDLHFCEPAELARALSD